jgi:hypothetical protein
MSGWVIRWGENDCDDVNNDNDYDENDADD